MRDAIERRLESLRESQPIYLTHHPSCAYYDHHTFEVAGIGLCMGCFVVYPVAALSVLALTVLELTTPYLSGVGTLGFWLAGGALLAPMVSYKLLYRRGSKYLFEVIYRVGQQRLRMANKALLAMGLAALAFPVPFRPTNPLITGLAFVGFVVAWVGYKGVTALDECEACPEQPEFPNCSGMDFDD